MDEVAYRRGVRRRVLGAWVCLLGLAAVAGGMQAVGGGWGRLAVVRTADGVTYEGEVREEAMMVIVRDRRGIESRIPRERVVSIRFREETELEFNRQYGQLAREEIALRVELAKFAMAERRPDLARRVLLEVLELNPNHREAGQLYDVVRSQLELERRGQQAAGGGSGVGGGGGGGAVSGGEGAAAARRTGAGGRNLLSPEQINLVRQAELRLGETNVPLRFDNDVERRFAAQSGATIASLRQRTPLERFMVMKEAGDPSLLGDIRVMRDPAALLEFRNRVQPRILSGCATSGCHGGSEGAGGLHLFSPATGEAEAYTNFFTLATGGFAVRGADGRTTRMRMIDRISPERSLLLQFMLPPEVAGFGHPAVQGFRPLFRSPDADGFRQVLGWIANSLTPIEPRYGFEFPAPVGVGEGPATTAPSTTEPADGMGPR